MVRQLTIGTKEWANSNVNCYFGCSNNCLYCYAKAYAIRFGRKTEENWKVMIPNSKAINKDYRKRNGRIMFPTSHDITLLSIQGCMTVLEKLLAAGNEVLVTTKPGQLVIHYMNKKFASYKKQMQYRFTITSMNWKKLAFWEPNAPGYSKRYYSLRSAFRDGFKTSVSIEPFLDDQVTDLIKDIQNFVTESIWIGPMNSRYCPPDLWDENLWGPEGLSKLQEKIFLDDEIDSTKIRYKDSFINTITSSKA